jgi:DNA-binding CsgD family transcriptional regulator
MSVCRGHHRESFSDQELGALRRLVPHLQTAISNHWKWVALNGALGTARTALESISAGMFMLGDRARLMYANKRGDDLLLEGLWVCSENNVVRCGRKVVGVQGADRALNELLCSGIGFSVQLSAGQRHAILVGVPCSPNSTAGTATPDTRAILWLIQETISRTPIQLAAKLFQLTAAEQRLLAFLGKGVTLSEAADLLGVKPNTVRSQLNSVFAKTGRNRQSELLALIHRIGMLDLC